MAPKKQKAAKPRGRKPNKQKKQTIQMLTAPKPFQLTKLKYQEEIPFMLSDIELSKNHLYRVNDIYDPNLTGIGHQPYFRDQMYALYEKARCLSAKITVKFHTASAALAECLLFPISDQLIETDYFVAKERKNAKYAPLNSIASRTLTCYCSTAKDLGVKASAVKNDDLFIQYQGSSLGNQQQNQYQITVRKQSITTGSVNVIAYVTLEQVVLFSDPRQQVAS